MSNPHPIMKASSAMNAPRSVSKATPVIGGPRSVLSEVQMIIAAIVAVEPEEIASNSLLEDYPIDVFIKIIKDLNAHFTNELEGTYLKLDYRLVKQQFTTIQELVRLIEDEIEY
jgi:hypothetical protein